MPTREIQAIQLAPGLALACVACGSAFFQLFEPEVPEIEIWRCRTCGTACRYPQPRTEQLDRHYAEDYYGPDNVKFLGTIERVIAWWTRRRALRIDKQIGCRGRVLEIGCGRGLLLRELARLGHECHGTERSELAARRARATAGIHVCTKPLEECGFPEAYFDFVVLWHVLEHLPAPGQTLQLLAKLLKPGGVLYLEVPSLSSWQAQLSGRNWFHLDPDRHLFHFTADGLRQLLGRQHFHYLRRATLSLEQGPYGVLQSWLNGLGFRPQKLYRILKRELAVTTAERWLQFGLAALLLVPAWGFAMLESCFGRGGILRVMARRTS